ncbi:helix-turn-helix transcriptional regulator [Cellulomonas bogoriensis]|uniref:DeoR faimly transcriptional regulator n=1 Tax=Cellulomonas bogoriensis 69B4 = DSM 16987 TaxID=1386082 RepID=A0A0A0BXB2_9CELL|nr:YafY family protein [Cellulomonas bogoriensis]KGM13048.1 DeoR faimly transcriptional regulator [Cellulomonas bogoriensis 69B4 = DSM 16987]
MRADRLLSLLWMLRARGSLTAPAVARELGVSVRTVYRDVESLSTAGVPVYCVPGRGGGIRLDPGFRTDVTGLTPQESQALLAAAAVSGAQDLGLLEALTSARLKLTAALPASTRDAVDMVTGRVVVDAGGWLPHRTPVHLDALQHAVMGDRRVRIGYRSRGTAHTRDRHLDAFGLVCSAGTWYLAGAQEGRVRFFHLARISSVEVLDEPTDRPPDLDLRGLWEESRARFRARFTPEPVEALVRPDRIAELLTLAQALEPPGPGTSPGYSRVLLRFSDRSHAVEVLRRFGPDALVLEPADLRETLLVEARSTCLAYEQVSGSAGPRRGGRPIPPGTRAAPSR